MRISTTACYALQLLIALAEQESRPEHPLSAAELAKLTAIPEKFARKILRLLNDAGLVRSIRGIAGGHALSTPVESVTLASIIRAVEGGFVPPSIQQGASPGGMATEGIWMRAIASLERALEDFTLKHIMDSLSESLSPCGQRTEVPQTTTEEASGKQDSGTYHAKAAYSLGRQRSRKSGMGNPDTQPA